MKTNIDWRNGYTMRDAINAGVYYHVRISHWASGGEDVAADSPAEAALRVGCSHAAMGFIRGVALVAEVFRHLPQSRIGCAVMEECGSHETLTADHYAI
jgi:hypothetical protein